LPVSFAGKIAAEFFTDLDGVDFIHKAGIFLGRIFQVFFFIPKGFGLDFPLTSIHVDLLGLESHSFCSSHRRSFFDPAFLSLWLWTISPKHSISFVDAVSSKDSFFKRGPWYQVYTFDLSKM
jgi:hypothetical protein